MNNRIKELRTAKGLSQDALGELAGTTGVQISRLETGRRRLSQPWMERLAAALGCAPSDLLDGSPRWGVRVPIHFRTTEWGADDWRTEAGRGVTIPEWGDSEGLFGVEIADNSANRMYPVGSVVVCQPLNGRAIHDGDQVAAQIGQGIEAIGVRICFVNITPTGDISLTVPTREADLADSYLITTGMGEGQAFYGRIAQKGAESVEYQPRPSDRVKIIGTVIGGFLTVR